MKKKKMSAPPPRKGGSAVKSKPKNSNLSFEKPEAVFTPPKLVVVGVEGWGKTSLAAHISDVGLLMPSTETGYKTLLGIGSVPQVPCLVTETWKETLDALDSVREFKALALDELSGFEAQCQDFICKRDYNGKWDNFANWGKGYKVVAPEWRKFLAKLESLDIMVLALSHCAIETFKDPMADDHDRYVSALHKSTWGLTRKWADACLFGTFESIVDDEGKGIGGTDRVLLTEHRDTHDAKNRYNLDPEIEMPDDATETWGFLWNHIIGEKE